MKFGIDRIFEIKALLRELGTGLQRLDFINNFESFEAVDVALPANTETKIRNELQFIPTKMLIVKQTGNALITAGSTNWNTEYLYVMNHAAATAATATIVFFK